MFPVCSLDRVARALPCAVWRYLSRHTMLLLPLNRVLFSGLGLRKGINFRFLYPYIGSGFENVRGTPLSEI